jgi:hypothetical protein
MTVHKTGLFAALVLCGTALAQTATPSPTTQTAPSSTQPASGQVAAPTASPADSQASNRIAPGSVIPVQLTKTIDAKKAKTGDQVEAKVTQDLKNGQGQVIVTKDTKVLGHVTEAQARNKEQKESQVGIAFDHAVMKGGGDMQMPMSIQAVIGSMNPNANGNGNNNNENNQSASPTSSAPAGGTSGAGSARTGGMGTGASSPNADTATASTAKAPNANGASQGQANGPITGNTQGVVGISDLKLSAEPTAAQGSMLSSDKNNVKLESGTLLLLKVNP